MREGLANEMAVRLACFAGAFALLALAEAFRPRRPRRLGRGRRWPGNLGLVVVDSLALRFLVPLPAVATAMMAQERGWGVFHNIDLPYALAFVASIVALDFVIYLQHVLFHAVPVLWRLHMVHHADVDLDVTSGVRFHPVEVLLSMGIKVAAVVVLGAPAGAVVAFEVLLNATSMFNHSNLALPLAVDRFLRLVVVTPDMHRVHHSIERNETNSNFGFNLPWWDRLCGTYKPQPRAGQLGMTIGLTQFQEPRPHGLLWLLSLPFRARTGPYPINRRSDGD